LAPAATAQSSAFAACYVPQVGAMYLIKRTGLPSACLGPAHVEIGWTQGGADSLATFLQSTGTVNAMSNPVDWTKLKGVPAGFADGVDDGGTSYTASGPIILTGTTFSLSTSGCAVGDAWKFVGPTWNCDPVGTVTSITTGAGLTGGTITGAGTVAANFAGSGVATTVARSDHTHAVGGTNSTGVGQGALAVNNGESNTAVGADALANVSGAGFNTAIGQGALRNNVSGGNTAVGASALAGNTSGSNNTAVGLQALGGGAGANNTAVGSGALASSTSGAGNTALGTGALSRSADGGSNTAVGVFALSSLTSGSNNIAIGSGVGGPLVTGSDNIYIGSATATSESNTLRIGGLLNNTSYAFIAGIRGVTTGYPAVGVVIDLNGQLGTVSSSRRFKQDIHEMGDASHDLLRLRPVSFRYKQPSADGTRPIQYGLIAEEVADVYPELVAYDSTGQPTAVMYHVLPAMLLNEVQRQERELVSLRQALAAQSAALDDLRAELRKNRTPRPHH